jgi:DNA-binding GntR family transcriptional regulator
MQANVQIDILCEDLRQQIVNRGLLPGVKLSEISLSRMWNVSRTPVREVLRRLEAEGLISYARNKGFIVQRITLEDVEQLYTIKTALESLAGRLATSLLASEQIEKLEDICRNMQHFAEGGEIEGYVKANKEFHHLIWHSCQSKWLIKILQNLDMQVHRFIVNALHIPNRIKDSVTDHLEIYEKIKKGDGKGVEKAIARHFQGALEAIKKELR